MAAINGYEQLLKDYESRLPDILAFIIARLHECNDPLFHHFASYMRDRRDTTEMDTFRLGLCWEQSHWSESVLQNLEENQVVLPRFTIHVIRVNGIRKLIDELFSKLGITEVSDDD